MVANAKTMSAPISIPSNLEIRIREANPATCLHYLVLIWAKYCREITPPPNSDNLYFRTKHQQLILTAPHIHIYIYTYLYIYIYIPIMYISTHKYIHTYIHTDRQTDRQTDSHTYIHYTYIHRSIHVKTPKLWCFISVRPRSGRLSRLQTCMPGVHPISVCLEAWKC